MSALLRQRLGERRSGCVAHSNIDVGVSYIIPKLKLLLFIKFGQW